MLHLGIPISRSKMQLSVSEAKVLRGFAVEAVSNRPIMPLTIPDEHETLEQSRPQLMAVDFDKLSALARLEQLELPPCMDIPGLAPIAERAETYCVDLQAYAENAARSREITAALARIAVVLEELEK